MSIGTEPANRGPALIDTLWARGTVRGQNQISQSGLTATAGGTKAAALQLATGRAFYQFDTVVTNNDSALLPAAVVGDHHVVFNNGAANLALYARGTDVINQNAAATSYVLTPGQAAHFYCTKAGQWAAIKSA